MEKDEILTPHCSGIKNANKVTLEDATTKGFVPCKRCTKKTK